MHKNRKHPIYMYDESLAVYFCHFIRTQYDILIYFLEKAKHRLYSNTFNRNERNAFYFDETFFIRFFVVNSCLINNTWMDGKYRLCINVLGHWRTYVCIEQYDKCFSNKMKWYDLYSTWLIWSYCFFHFKLHSPKLNQTNENKKIKWLEFYHHLLFVCIIQTTTSVFVIRNEYCKMKTKKT